MSRRCDLIPQLEGKHPMSYQMGPWTFHLTLSDVAYRALRSQAVAEATKDAQKRSPEFAEAMAEARERAEENERETAAVEAGLRRIAVKEAIERKRKGEDEEDEESS